MDPVTTAGILSAGTQFGTQFLGGYQNRRAQERAFRYNTNMWHMQNKYNSPVEQMKRLREAGLNPMLIYGTGHATSTGKAEQMPKYQAEQYQYNVEPDFVSMMMAKHQKDVLKQNVQLTRAQAIKTLAEVPGIRSNNKIKAILAKYQEQMLETGLADTESQIAKRSQDITESEQRIITMAQTRSVMEVEKALKRSNIQLNRHQQNKINHEVTIMWKKIALEKGHLEQEKIRTEIMDFSETIKANFPGIDKVAGAAIINALMDIASWFGAEYDQDKSSIKRK
jgi:hypothetical protein